MVASIHVSTALTTHHYARPVLALVAAVANNGVIGARNALPWRLPDDLRHFRVLTTGHAIVMGRNTWESIGRPLPGRQNIVVTTQADYEAAGAQTAPSLAVALTCVRMPSPVYCIGGGALYVAALPQADRLHLTEIARPFEGDVMFPPFDRAQWIESARDARITADGLAYAIMEIFRAFAMRPCSRDDGTGRRSGLKIRR
jgi:dihydrofolate reductase